MAERGEVIGFYAVTKLKDGGHCFEFMSRHQINGIMSKTQSKGAHGPWKDNFVEMGRKTVIRRLSKYLPLSVEFQTASALDGLSDAGKDQHLDTVINGEINIMPDDAPIIEETVDPDTGEITQDEKTPASIPLTFSKVADQINKAKTLDDLDLAADDIRRVSGEKFQEELRAMYESVKTRLGSSLS
jgi:recombination protein RecT